MAKSADKKPAETPAEQQITDIPAETIAEVSPAKKSAVSMYSIDELTAAEKKLGAKRIIIRTALRKAGKTMYSLEDAQKIVKEFKERKV